MRRFSFFLVAIAVVASGCGDAASSTTSSPGAPADDPLETLPPTTTLAPPTTAPDPVVTTTRAVTTTTGDPLVAEVGTPTITGEALPPAGPDPDPAIGAAAPIVVGSDFTGGEVTVGGEGPVRAVLFVAHWCSHCQSELPQVVDWLDATGGVAGVEIVLVTVGVDPNLPNFPPSAWLAREGWTGPVLRDDAENSIFYAFGGSSVPFWVFLEPDGTVAARIPGRAPMEEVQRILEELVASA